MTLLVPALLASAVLGADKLAVVDTDSPDAMIGLAAQVNKATLDAAAELKLDVITPDELRAKIDPKKYEQLRKCGGKPLCVSQYLGQVGATRAVLSSINRDDKSYLLRLWLIDLNKLEVIADVDRQVLIAARRLQRDIEQAVPPLLRGEQEARGTLAVACNVKNASITVNGDLIGPPPIELKLKPGKYEVKVERKKYLSVTRLMAVEANQKTEEVVKLLLMPGELPDEESVPVLTKNAATETGPVHISVATWVSAGVTLVAAGLATGFGIASSSADAKLLAGYDSATGVYTGSRKDALGAQQSALAANICFGITGAAAVATTVFLVLDLVSPGPVTVAPSASPTGASILVGGHF